MDNFKLCGNLYLRVAKGKNSGKRYVCIVCNLGYTLKFLTFNSSDICELLELSPKELADIKEGDYLIQV